MSLKAKYIAIFAVLSAAIYTACRKDVLPDDPPITPDPCAGIVPVHANFKVFESRNGAGAGFIYEATTDTVMVWNHVVYEDELKDAESYEWRINGNTYIGSRVVYPGVFNWQVHTAPRRDTVTLIVNKTPSACHPEDDGIDTLTRLIYVAPRQEWPFLGTFHGELFSIAGAYIDTLTVSIENIAAVSDPDFSKGTTYIHNLDGAGCVQYVSNYGNSWSYYRYFEYKVNVIDCNSLYGYGYVNKSGDSLILNYQTIPSFDKKVDVQFRAKKL